MGLVGFFGLLCLFSIAGRGIGRCVVSGGEGRAFRFSVYLASGLLLAHLVLAWLDVAGVAWRPSLLGALGAAIVVAGHRLVGPPRGHRGEEAVTTGTGLRIDWADGLAMGVMALFAVLAYSTRITFPDFIYHWGLKGHRYFLARGVDYDFLTREWNLLAHPEYPQLVPELYALHSLASGRFPEAALLLWSAVLLGVLLAAGREALRAHDVAATVRRWTFAILVLAVATFAVGYLMAGSADWIVALALVAFFAALRRLPHPAAELQIGIFAALAAATKLEGVSLALWLVAGAVWRCRRRSASALGWTALRLGGPPLLATLPWVVQGVRHGLFGHLQSGGFEVSRAAGIAATLGQTMLRPEWHLVPLALVALPLLLALRETRLLAAVVSLQLAVYVVRYFTATFDYEFAILSSFPRLMFHVLPAVLLALGLAADRWRRPQGAS